MEIVGFLIGISLVSVIGAVLLRFGARFVTKTPVGFSKPFWITFASVTIAYMVQLLLGRVLAPLPAVSMFVTTWLFCTSLVGRGEDGANSYAKALAIASIQFVGLMLIVAVIAVSMIAIGGK